MLILFDNPLIFILVLTRISAMLSFSIFFGDKRISSFVKVALCSIIAILITPNINCFIDASINDATLIIALFKEFLIGSIIGLSTTVISHCFGIAGALVDIQGGFGMAQVFDPSTKTQSSLMSQLFSTIALIMFVTNGLHTEMLRIFIKTFNAIPLGGNINYINIISLLLKCILMGAAIAIPVISIVFMIDIILGISAKTMPQISLFSVGFMIKCFATIFFVYLYTIAFSNLTRYVTNVVFSFITNNLL